MEQTPTRCVRSADLLSPPTGGASGRAIVIEPWLKQMAGRAGARPAQADLRAPEARLTEASGLARAIDLAVVQEGLVPLGEIRPATYIGKGKVDEIAGLVKSLPPRSW